MCGLEYQRTCNTRVCERLACALRIIRIRMNWIGCRAMWSYTWGRWLWSPNKPEVGDDLMQNVMPPWTHLFKVGFACVHTSIRNPRAKGIQMDIYGDDEEDDDHLERMGCRGWCPPEVDVFWEPLDEVGYCTPLFVASGLSVLVSNPPENLQITQVHVYVGCPLQNECRGACYVERNRRQHNW